MQPALFRPIGFIRSPFTDVVGMPIQPAGAMGIPGTVELAEEFAPGLRDIEEFSYLILIYHLHLSTGGSLEVIPFMDDRPHGIFATRSPKRPNPIGISVVRLTGVEEGRLLIQDVDVVDGTPLLDIKPYVPALDVRQTDRIGWYAGRVDRVVETLADDRFVRK
jgi:tRNA (adenine37-N6)-methyltransferase